MAVSRGDREIAVRRWNRLEMEARGSMSIQPGERERARFDVPPPDRDRGPGPTFGQALRRHWRVMVAMHRRAGPARDRATASCGRPNYAAETRLAVGGLNASTPVARSRASRPRLSSSPRPTAAPCRATRWCATSPRAEDQPRPGATPSLGGADPRRRRFSPSRRPRSRRGTSIDMSRLASRGARSGGQSGQRRRTGRSC